MTSLLLIPLATALWRFAGGAWFASSLPGRPVWYVIPILALAAGWVSGGWPAAAVVVAGLLAVSFLPHGRWYMLNNKPRELAGAPNKFEAWIERICDRGGRDDYACLAAVKVLAFIPLMLMTAFMGWSLAFVAAAIAPLVILLGYMLGWELADQGKTSVPTSFGEYAAGLIIGFIILGMGVS